jgi:hypothetical protein
MYLKKFLSLFIQEHGPSPEELLFKEGRRYNNLLPVPV